MAKLDFISEMFNKYGDQETVIAALTQENTLESKLNLQVFLNAIGREEESFAISNELMKDYPENTAVKFNNGWHWLKRGELKKGMELLENGRELNTYGNGKINTSRPIWNPETGKRQTVLLSLEGGFGDEIIHFRFCQDLADNYDCKVIALCSPSIAQLFNHQPYVSAVAQKEAAPGIYHDAWVPGMSAALVLGYEYSDISSDFYIYPNPKMARQWSSILRSDKLKIGIRWAGSPAFEHQQLRKFDPSILTDLSNNPNVQLYSFQRDDNLIDLPSNIVDLGPHIKTWDDTAAAIHNMDLMISSCTSVAHLSAAMGKPTWVLVPALPYFPWAMPGNTSPWYNSVRLFRQKAYGNWDDVKDDLNEELLKLI